LASIGLEGNTAAFAGAETSAAIAAVRERAATAMKRRRRIADVITGSFLQMPKRHAEQQSGYTRPAQCERAQCERKDDKPAEAARVFDR
jgi:hypothetical protein